MPISDELKQGLVGDLRRCKQCGIEKMLSEFKTDLRCASGRSGLCLKCYADPIKKVCVQCGGLLEIRLFHVDRRKSDERKPACRECTNKAKAAWRKKNSEKIKAQKAASYHRNRQRYLDYMRSPKRRAANFIHKLEHEFGITNEEYMLLLEIQEGRCAICRLLPTEVCSKRERLCIDHDHITGKVRGLLCLMCNAGIGYFRDDPNTVSIAARYLRKPTTNGLEGFGHSESTWEADISSCQASYKEGLLFE